MNESDARVKEIIDTHLGGVLVTDEMRKGMEDALPVRVIYHTEKHDRLTYCTACGKHGVAYAQDVAHKQRSVCPICGAQGIGLEERYAGKKSYDERVHYMYRRSEADPDVLIAMSIWCCRDWRWIDSKRGNAPEDVDTEIEVRAIAMIPYGGKPVLYRHEAYRGGSQMKDWWKQSERTTMIGWMSLCGTDIQRTCWEGMLAKAARGTPHWAPMLDAVMSLEGIMHSEDYFVTLMRCATRPGYEYMIKAGQGELVKQDLMQNGRGVVNWRKGSPKACLGLTGDEWGRVKSNHIQLTAEGLMVLQLVKKHGEKLKLEDGLAMGEQLGTIKQGALRSLCTTYGERLGVVNILRYLYRQMKKRKNYFLAGDLADYWQDCATLGESLTDSRTAFPKDLLERKAEIVTRVKIKQDEETSKTIAERVEALNERYAFSACGLTLSPFGSAQEVIDEGTIQHICIGSYVKSYAAGQTILCKLRRNDAPDAPFHAVEFSADTGKMVQCRGLRNQTLEEDEMQIRNFWKAWDKKRKTKTNVSLTIDRGTRQRRTA